MSEPGLRHHEVRQESQATEDRGGRALAHRTGRRHFESTNGEARRGASVWVAAVAMLVVACGGRSVASPEPPAPVPAHWACPVPSLSTSGWLRHADSAGVAYRLPPDLVQRPAGDLPYRQWSTSDSSGRVSIGFSPSREHWITLRRAPSPGMHEMSECVEEGRDRQVLIQSWRTEGGVFRDGRRFDRYDVSALVPVEPMLTLFITGGSSDPRFQEILLAVARTVTVEAPRP